MRSGSSAPLSLAAIAGLCLIAVAQGGVVWYFGLRGRTDESAGTAAAPARVDTGLPARYKIRVPPPPPPAPAASGEETVVPPASPADGEALWVEVWRTGGRGDKETPRFRVGSAEWRVVMTAGEPPPNVSGSVQVRVRDGQRRKVAEDRLVGPAADTVYVRAGPGLYHFSVESFETPWAFAVQEKRVPAEALQTRPDPNDAREPG